MTASNQSLKAEEINLRSLFFRSDVQFVVPEYQRPYTWGTNEALQLVDDLEDALERDGDEPYFLGSLILVNPDSLRAEVIDGQQRLTTLTILLSVLRDLVQDGVLKYRIHSFVEQEADTADGEPTLRLKLRPRDCGFFKTNVQSMGGTVALVDLKDGKLENDAQRRIRDNANAIRARLYEWDQKKLQDFYNLLAWRTFLVVVSTLDLSSAYRIFSVMNSRGLPLAPSDIFKSYVVGAIEGDKSEYAKRWEDLEVDLGRDDFTDLFFHLRAIFSKARAAKNIVEEFPEQVLKPYLEHENGDGFIDEVLEPYAKAYLCLLSQDFQGANAGEINAWMKRLNQLDNKDWRPVALWALTNHSDDSRFLVEFFKKLERLAASMLLRRVYATPRVQRYMELLRQLDAGEGLSAEKFELTSDERRESYERLNGEVYAKTSLCKYVLLRLDEILADAPGVTYDHKIISVEHVLPQNPRDNSLWLEDFTDEQRAYWTHRLGNLLLLNRKKNSQARNYDFAKKKNTYFQKDGGISVFAITTQVINQSEWTPEVVEKRHNELVDLLSGEWDLA